MESFVDKNNSKVIKLFKMMRPSYNLPSRKWISTEILDQVHKEVDRKIQKFAAEAKFLTLSGDGWTNISKQSMATFSKAAETILSLKDSIRNADFWEKLKAFYDLLIRFYDHIIMILESEQATLGQVAASWAWLRGIIEKLPSSEKGISPTKLLYIQEIAYSLFCTLYPDKNNNAFVDEWLDYQNQKAPNLAEFACRLFSILPNSATSERVWSLMEKSFINKSKKTKGSLNIYNKLNDNINNDDTSDEDNMDVDELMNDLGEISVRIIDDINIFETNNNSEPPTLLEIFNPQLIKIAIVKGIDVIL
ncbi:hypothetical protein C1645_823400 [Glomus cerebriforme]|uniref:HAT C-terminal dimerisation domain-containing protein n=1 Tax=Glomus cerebriforme TaxID=658196 RepID=A0A397SWH6_9GLOM|nr:hypothetical protein C1645_823400 [Glomus cerebriforme]